MQTNNAVANGCRLSHETVFAQGRKLSPFCIYLSHCPVFVRTLCAHELFLAVAQPFTTFPKVIAVTNCFEFNMFI